MPSAAEESDTGTAEVPDIKTEEEPGKRPPGHVRETVVLVVLSITAVLTAWCGFQSSQWSGEMSIAFSEASGARIEAARQAGVANAARQADLSIWGVYLQARAHVEQRFTDHFRVAYNAWHAQGEPTSGPFKMKEYVPPGTTESAAADQQADSRFADALKFNQRGDNYTILTDCSRWSFLCCCVDAVGLVRALNGSARTGDHVSRHSHGDPRI